MKAAVLNSCPGQLEIEEVGIDKPGPREVLIHTAVAGLCHSDLHFMEGKYPAGVPVVLGHESAGIVEAVGEDVTYVKPGDHVIRSEEHTSELQSLMRISYAVFCLKKKNNIKKRKRQNTTYTK